MTLGDQIDGLLDHFREERVQDLLRVGICLSLTLGAGLVAWFSGSVLVVIVAVLPLLFWLWLAIRRHDVSSDMTAAATRMEVLAGKLKMRDNDMINEFKEKI